MKKYSILIPVLMLVAACSKNNNEFQKSSSPVLSSAKGGSGGGGGGNTTTGLLSSVGGAFRLIGGNSDSIQVNFTQAAPAAGYTITLSSSDPSVQLPASFFVTAGTFNAHPPLTSTRITSAKNVVITVRLGAESKSYTLKVFPYSVVFPSPQLQSPGNGSGVKSRLQVKFQWSDNTNAYYHDIQISDNTSFINPMLEVYLNDPIWAASYFNGLGVRYWRVRYIDGSGTAGPWSETRNFEVKP